MKRSIMLFIRVRFTLKITTNNITKIDKRVIFNISLIICIPMNLMVYFLLDNLLLLLYNKFKFSISLYFFFN